jgi:hypothetical protein
MVSFADDCHICALFTVSPARLERRFACLVATMIGPVKIPPVESAARGHMSRSGDRFNYYLKNKSQMAFL